MDHNHGIQSTGSVREKIVHDYMKTSESFNLHFHQIIMAVKELKETQRVEETDIIHEINQTRSTAEGG